MAVTRREQEIIDRSEMGISNAGIAAELGLSEVYVRSILQNLSGNDSYYRAHCSAMTAASAALAAAINRMRGA